MSILTIQRLGADESAMRNGLFVAGESLTEQVAKQT